jgi:hypothetical protein
MKTKILSQLKVFIAAGVLAAALLTSGCIAVVAAAGAGAAVAYKRGDLEAWVDAGFDKTAKAANLAVQQLGFAKISETKDAVTDIITARNAADKKIEIHLGHGGNSLTQVKIRVGVFGDESLSVTVLEKIKANL